MAVSLYKKRIRGHPYWYARECQRVGGKPRIVWQKYLGKADAIAAAVGAVPAPGVPPRPRETVLAEFGAVAALYDLTQALDLVATIDRHAGKRAQGVSVGTYLTVAALNRCVAPTSKARLGAWYQQTVLRRLMPVASRALTSQRFWAHMSYLDAPQIAAIEQDLTRTVLERFHLDLRCLFYDTTNFATFIDSFNTAPTLAQRGKSKQKRSDLRLVGLALLVSRDFQVPLFHHVYAGNTHDAPTFTTVIEALVARYRLFATQVQDITLVYDKGNNSAANQAMLDRSEYHVVGSLSPVQHPDLLAVPRRCFRRLTGADVSGVEVWRTEKTVLGATRTVVVTYNPRLFATQRATLVREIHKATGRLHALQRHLAVPPRRGRPRTVASVEKEVAEILHARHLKALVRTTVTPRHDRLELHYRLDTTAWRRLQRTVLGKSLLFTDHVNWSDEEIVRAYRGQHHIEAAFKRMKDPHFVSWRPLFHWTDQKIRVHAFYCVLALLLTALLRRTLAHRGVVLSISKILHTLSGITEVALLYPGARNKPVITYSRLTKLQAQLVTALNLDRFHAA
jgi:transposase